MTTAVRYLALGDSYTIGTGASDESRTWPAILSKRLVEATGRQVELTNPAVNGYTTLDLIRHEMPYVQRLKPDPAAARNRDADLVQLAFRELLGLPARHRNAPEVAVVEIADA